MFFLETFPATDDVEILPLATPSAEFDPEILDLYSRVSTDLPVAVPVNENGLGDWFYDAAITAAKYLGPILSRAGHPLLQAAGTAANAIYEVSQQKPTSGANQTTPNTWEKPPKQKFRPGVANWEGNIPERKKKKKNKKPKKIIQVSPEEFARIQRSGTAGKNFRRIKNG